MPEEKETYKQYKKTKMPQDTPTEEIIEMQQRGNDDADIISYLTKKGYTADQISEAINMAKIKSEVSDRKSRGVTGLTPSILGREEGEEAPVPEEGYEEPAQEARAPMPQQQEYGYEEQPYAAPQAQIDTETIEEIAEEVVNEKWGEIKERIEDVIEWKDYTEKRLKSFEDRIKRTELSLDSLQVALIGKIQAYSNDIKDLGKEMQSLEGAFSKVLSPLVTNVKDISSVAGKMKDKREDKFKSRK